MKLLLLALLLLGCSTEVCAWTRVDGWQPEPATPEEEGSCWFLRAPVGGTFWFSDGSCPPESADGNAIVIRAGYLDERANYFVNDPQGEPRVLRDVPCNITSSNDIAAWELGCKPKVVE